MTVRTAYGTRRILNAAGLRGAPAAKTFWIIPNPPIAMRNHVFCFNPATMTSNNVQQLMRTREIERVHGRGAGAAEASASRSHMGPLQTSIITCWCPLPRVRQMFLVCSSLNSRVDHFSALHCGIEPE